MVNVAERYRIYRDGQDQKLVELSCTGGLKVGDCFYIQKDRQ